MQLALTEDQVLLSRTANDLFAETAPVTRLRRLRDSHDELGYTPALFQRMAGLGLTAIPFSEADGGLGLGLAELVLVTEAMGRALAPEPIIPSVALAGRALALAGSLQHKEAWLPGVIAGERVLALAHAQPTSRFDPVCAPFRAERTRAGFQLRGQASQVWGGHLADAYIVSARTSGSDRDPSGITLFLVPRDTPQLSSERQSRIDSLNTSLLTLDGVERTEADVLGTVGNGHAVLTRVLDEATVALCGEMLGGMTEAFERTLAYLRERRQFGAPIGSFQALAHRAARLFIELSLARPAVMAAARAMDEGREDHAQLVSVAKARCSDAYCLVANEAVQLHGGIGMTDEHDIGLFLKRARAAEMTFGDAAYHRARYARLGGF